MLVNILGCVHLLKSLLMFSLLCSCKHIQYGNISSAPHLDVSYSPSKSLSLEYSYYHRLHPHSWLHGMWSHSVLPTVQCLPLHLPLLFANQSSAHHLAGEDRGGWCAELLSRWGAEEILPYWWVRQSPLYASVTIGDGVRNILTWLSQSADIQLSHCPDFSLSSTPAWLCSKIQSKSSHWRPPL